MAQRRMFSKSVVRSDAFMDMPTSSRELYFQLGMEADDEGFVGNPRMVERMLGASDDDMKVLLAKRFILTFPSGVIVVKHWKLNNYIQADRGKPTEYTDEKKLIKVKENKAYTECIQNVSKMDAQYSIGEERIVKNTTPETGVEEVSQETKKDTPIDLKEEIKKLEENPRRDMNIIALYLNERKPDIRTKQQYQVTLRRHLRPAKLLMPFTDNQILKAVEKARQYPEWTIETLVKMVTK